MKTVQNVSYETFDKIWIIYVEKYKIILLSSILSEALPKKNHQKKIPNFTKYLEKLMCCLLSH